MTPKLIQEQITVPAVFHIAPSAIQERDNLLAMCRELVSVENAEEQIAVTGAGIAIQRHLKEVSEVRFALSRPLDAAKKALVKLEDDYGTPLEQEKQRLSALISAFQRRERERVEVEERTRREEIARLEQERVEAERKAEKAKGKKAVAAEQRAYEAAEAAEAVIMASPPTASKAQGARTSQKLCFRVTNIQALYTARPDLCRIEANAAAIQATCHPNLVIPGLELWFEDRTHFATR